MIFYELEIVSGPRVLFAYTVESGKYRNFFYHKKDFLEISVCTEGRMIFAHKEKAQEIAYPGMIVPILGDMNCDTYAFENEQQQHITVGMRVQYRSRRYEKEEECDFAALEQRLKTGNVILIPHFYDPGERMTKITACLKEIISNHYSENPNAQLNAVSGWYKLCAILTEIVYTNLRNAQDSLQFAEQMYVKKAIQYIGQNSRTQPAVGEIADFLKISAGYLQRIFRKSMNCTLIDYMNRQRILALIDLAENKHLNLREAAFNVGIEDPAYASRLFRKVMGISFREYFSSGTHKVSPY